MIQRSIFGEIQLRLGEAPAVALIGPRQVGKTTLALQAGAERDAVYLDCESPTDRAKLSQAELFFADHRGRLVILDEIHRVPDLFPILRGQIDQARRAGHKTGQYLLLGSASLDLIERSGESLAGRIAYVNLGGFTLPEVRPTTTGTGIPALATVQDRLWLRGGFPESFTAPSNATSFRWRMDFIRTYLERDIVQFGFRLSPELLRRFWTMLAHNQGGLLNVTQLGRNLGVDVKTAQSYLDLLISLLLVRRLSPWHTNVGKRLVKTPKVYVRDSGLVHALLGIADKDSLLGHPVIGASWEGFAIENLLTAVGDRANAYFYRTSAGAEIDLVLEWKDGTRWALEFKRSTTPKLEKGFHIACGDIAPERQIVVYAGESTYRMSETVTAMPLIEAMNAIVERSDKKLAETKGFEPLIQV